MQEVELGGDRSFIGAWILPQLEVCDDLLAYFHASPRQVPGQIGTGQVDPTVKDSRDLQITSEHFSNPAVHRYLENLADACHRYVDKFQASAAVDGWGLAENIAVQHYAPGGGYKLWHCERWGKDMPSAARHLVFMTYLNDVLDAGGTEFFYQALVVQPRKGLTLIWPADWTHLHRGIVSPTEHKYIVTGWLSFT